MEKKQHSKQTQVIIIGGGITGLWLSHLLHLQNIQSVLLESRSQAQVLFSTQTGLLERQGLRLLNRYGIAQSLQNEGLTHTGLDLIIAQSYHVIDALALTGETILAYRHHQLLKELMENRLAVDAEMWFDVSHLSLDALESDHPVVRYRHHQQEYQCRAHFVIGCDGQHGFSRRAMMQIPHQDFSQEYPFSWLTFLVKAPPSAKNQVYSAHERGFAMLGVAMDGFQAIALQCDLQDKVETWSDDRLWHELHTRFTCHGKWRVTEGPIVEKKIHPIVSFMALPMRSGRLFLAGDAAHVMPPTANKGLDMAISDACLLSNAIAAFYTKNSQCLLDHYGEMAANNTWRARYFSLWMTNVLHRFPKAVPFQEKLQQMQLNYLTISRAAATLLAENYVGAPLYTSHLC